MKNIYRNARRAVWSLVLLGAAFVASCGGDDASGGDPKDCKPNDTRSCVGPAACAGGQVCGADGKWGTCDCGGGTGGVNSDGGGAAAGVGASGGVGASAGSGGVAGAGGAAGGTGGASAKCPQGRGPVMIDVGTFCIDSTEVTQKQYQDFLDDIKGVVPPQSAECAWNTDVDVFAKSANCKTHGQKPAGCADWCDAETFCKWAGKRLCGKVGGGPLPADKFGVPWENEWVFACTQGAKTKYPWGDQPEANCFTGTCPSGVCGGQVATMPNCRGVTSPFDQVYDLPGNVSEWVNSCFGNECWVAGGSHGTALTECAVPADPLWSRTVNFVDFGFRCCADGKGSN